MILRQYCHQRATGFTFIELMFVVAIIGILAAIAIPSFEAYLIRSRFSEGFVMSLPAKEAVTNYYAHHGRMPANNKAAGLPPPEESAASQLSRIEVVKGAIRLVYRPEVLGKTWEGGEIILGLNPVAASGNPPSMSLGWVCGHRMPSEPMEYLGWVETTVPKEHLSSHCKE